MTIVSPDQSNALTVYFTAGRCKGLLARMGTASRELVYQITDVAQARSAPSHGYQCKSQRAINRKGPLPSHKVLLVGISPAATDSSVVQIPERNGYERPTPPPRSSRADRVDETACISAHTTPHTHAVYLQSRRDKIHGWTTSLQGVGRCCSESSGAPRIGLPNNKSANRPMGFCFQGLGGGRAIALSFSMNTLCGKRMQTFLIVEPARCN